MESGNLVCFEVFYIHLFVLYFKYNYFFHKYIPKYIKIHALLACKTIWHSEMNVFHNVLAKN